MLTGSLQTLKDKAIEIQNEAVKAQKSLVNVHPWDPPTHLATHFPNARLQSLVVEAVAKILERLKATDPLLEPWKKSHILFATCICADEINRDIEESTYCHSLGHPFSLGGLTGFPFTGVPGFRAYTHHVPTNGMMLIISGPHVGILSYPDHETNKSTVGHIRRSHMGEHISDACGASIGALTSSVSFPKTPKEILHTAQLYYVQEKLKPYLEELKEEKLTEDEKMALLPRAMAEQIKSDLTAVVSDTRALEAKDKKPFFPVVHLHGIQINFEGDTPPYYSNDYFDPISFEIFCPEGRVVIPSTELMPMLYQYCQENAAVHKYVKEQNRACKR